MPEKAALIDQIVVIMRSLWDLPADCNEGELFTYAEILFDRIVAGVNKDALDSFLRDVQVEKMEMPMSAAYSEIVDDSISLVRN